MWGGPQCRPGNSPGRHIVCSTTIGRYDRSSTNVSYLTFGFPSGKMLILGRGRRSVSSNTFGAGQRRLPRLVRLRPLGVLHGQPLHPIAHAAHSDAFRCVARHAGPDHGVGVALHFALGVYVQRVDDARPTLEAEIPDLEQVAADVADGSLDEHRQPLDPRVGEERAVDVDPHARVTFGLDVGKNLVYFSSRNGRISSLLVVIGTPVR